MPSGQGGSSDQSFGLAKANDAATQRADFFLGRLDFRCLAAAWSEAGDCIPGMLRGLGRWIEKQWNQGGSSQGKSFSGKGDQEKGGDRCDSSCVESDRPVAGTGYWRDSFVASRPDGPFKVGWCSADLERVQAEIRMEAARHGFEASHPIVAGGHQSCDPHERGHGALHARELIIIDIFPRDLKTGYWGDMTRTVLKGQANEAQRKQFAAVHAAHRRAFQKLKAGVDGRSVHRDVEALFKSRGYETGQMGGRYQGFFHGTGHGLGLEIHELPRMSGVSQRLRAGHVVTVEPGLYYRATGGVRIEDVAWIRTGGCERLSHFPVQLEI